MGVVKKAFTLGANNFKFKEVQLKKVSSHKNTPQIILDWNSGIKFDNRQIKIVKVGQGHVFAVFGLRKLLLS
jgi:hypothetical protein